MVRRDERTGEPIRRSLNETRGGGEEATEYVSRRPASDEDTRPVRRSAPAEADSSDTRILGMGQGGRSQGPTSGSARGGAVVGWLVVWSGPGTGISHNLGFGRNLVGRGPGCDVNLDHGDTSISSRGDAAIVYDPETSDFYAQPLEGKNIARLNDRPLLAPEALTSGSVLKIGETRLVFVPFCTPTRRWPV